MNESKTKKDTVPAIDRVILSKAAGEMVTKWVKELNDRADGLIRFTKADVVDYLIMSHAAKFTGNEVQTIAGRAYNEAKWLGWALAKIKASKKRGESLSFDDLMRFRDELLGKTPQPVRARRKRIAEDITQDALESKHDESPTE